MGISIKGLSELQDKLTNNIEKLNQNMEDTVGRLAQQIADDAKDLAPVDTGHLRENIFSRVTKDGDIIAGEAYSNVEYASYVEFGTGKVGESAGLQREGIDLHYRQTPWRYQDEEGNWHYTEGMKPQPFFYPAMKQNEDEIKEKLKTTAVLEMK